MKAFYDSLLTETGDLFSVKDFKEGCRCGSFTNNDGYGFPVRHGRVDRMITIKPSNINNIPQDASHIQWFNK